MHEDNSEYELRLDSTLLIKISQNTNMDGSNIFRDIVALAAIVVVCWYLVWKLLPKLIALIN